jgi:hypothetical protein
MERRRVFGFAADEVALGEGRPIVRKFWLGCEDPDLSGEPTLG